MCVSTRRDGRRGVPVPRPLTQALAAGTDLSAIHWLCPGRRSPAVAQRRHHGSLGPRRARFTGRGGRRLAGPAAAARLPCRQPCAVSRRPVPVILARYSPLDLPACKPEGPHSGLAGPACHWKWSPALGSDSSQPGVRRQVVTVTVMTPSPTGSDDCWTHLGTRPRSQVPPFCVYACRTDLFHIFGCFVISLSYPCHI